MVINLINYFCCNLYHIVLLYYAQYLILEIVVLTFLYYFVLCLFVCLFVCLGCIVFF